MTIRGKCGGRGAAKHLAAAGLAYARRLQELDAHSTVDLNDGRTLLMRLGYEAVLP